MKHSKPRYLCICYADVQWIDRQCFRFSMSVIATGLNVLTSPPESPGVNRKPDRPCNYHLFDGNGQFFYGHCGFFSREITTFHARNSRVDDVNNEAESRDTPASQSRET